MPPTPPTPRPPPPDRTTADLVEAARAGDLASFGRLVSRYEARVRAVAIALGLDPASAEDVAQEAFTAAYRGLADLSSAVAFPAWLVSIARNHAVSALRRRGLGPRTVGDASRLDVADPREGPGEAAVRAASRERVLAALATLDERSRFALTLRHHAGLSYAEIGETMTLPTTTIKGVLDRATRVLRGLLEGERERMRR